jgi:bacterioferritin (cytochrome b1)
MNQSNIRPIAELFSEASIESDNNKDPVMNTTEAELIPTEEAYNGLNPEVIDLLKQSLTIHWEQTQMLTAIGEHLDRWGYKKLAASIKADAEEEHKHATINLKRLEFFDITPTYNAAQVAWPRHDMVGIIKAILDSVVKAASVERALISKARSVGDELTANTTIPLLEGSEKGIIEMQSYLKLIDQMGLDNFLSIQI